MFTIAKSFAYKFCFCLGLGTASYYSYGEVQKWVRSSPIKTIENVVEKHVVRENTVYDDTYIPQEISYTQPNIVAQTMSAPAGDLAAAPPALPAATEEKKDEAKKEETADKKEETPEGTSIGMTEQIQGLPQAYAPQTGPAPASTHTAAEEKQSNPDIAISPNALASASPSSSSGVSGGTTSTSSFSTSNNLNAADIAALISPLKATFPDQMNLVNGLLCDVSGHNCTRRNHVAIHSLRWGMANGLKPDVTFSIKSAGGASLEFSFDFKIQNSSLAEENVSISAHPAEVLVHDEFKNSKNYRVMEFTFADLSILGEMVSQVQAVMTYEITATGLVLSSADSQLSFTRTKAQVSVAKWDPSSQNQSGVFLIADELVYSMNVAKSL